MKLPSAKKARIDKEKIVAYLLSISHPDGASKAEFFSRFGFTVAEWPVFADALKEHALVNKVKKTVESPYGIRYTVDGVIKTPDCRNPVIRTVWIIERGNNIPRLITAHPLEERVL